MLGMKVLFLLIAFLLKKIYKDNKVFGFGQNLINLSFIIIAIVTLIYLFCFVSILKNQTFLLYTSLNRVYRFKLWRQKGIK